MKLRAPGSPLVRGLSVLAAACGIGALFWWRGPDWGTVGHAFDAVRWQWVVVAISLNLMSRLNTRDLTLLSMDRNVPEPLRVAARRRVSTAGGS